MISRQNTLESASFLGQEQKFLSGMAACDEAATQKVPRKRIWDLSTHYHCSIIGTCLSAGERRNAAENCCIMTAVSRITT